MNLYGNLSGATGYAPATDAGANTAMRDTTNTENMLANKEAMRLARMRAEELRLRQEAYRAGGTQAQQPGQLDLADQSVSQRVNMASPGQPTPAARAQGVGPGQGRGFDSYRAPRTEAQPQGVGPGQGRGFDSYRAPLTDAEMQAQMDRLAMLKLPAAAADVVQAPMAGALNLGGAAINGLRNFGNRTVNAITGKPTLGADYEATQSFGLTPFYDKIRQEEARLQAYQQGARNLNKPNLAMPAQAPAGGDSALDAHMQERGMQRRNPRSPIYDYVPTEAGQAPAPSTPEFGALAAAVKQVESGGNPDAVSPKGAVGTMQTMPDTLRDPGFGVVPAKDDSAAERERVGQDYLQAMITKYGNVEHALVAYNWGPTNANKWIAAGADQSKLPKETREYIPKVMALLGGQQSAAPTGSPAGLPTKAATPKQASVMFAPENVANTQFQSTEFMRLAQSQLDENNRMLELAPDIATMETLRAKGEKLQSAAQSAVYMNVTARAASGDDNAMSTIALRVGVKYAITNDGQYIQAEADGNGQYKAVGKPMSRSDFATSLYGILTGASAARSAALAGEMNKAQANVYEAQGKGSVDSRLSQQEAAQQQQLELLKIEGALQKVIAEKGLDRGQTKVQFSPFDGKAYVVRNNTVFEVTPGQDMGDGMTSPPRLTPIAGS
tara:strand:+ start:1893 stop:3896 length:2004 start_codon:yes stop_codon:yes gene_type:complete